MPVWLIVVLTIYVLGVIGFLVAIFTEAPKHGADVGVFHFVVAIVWPIWVLWYGWATFDNWLTVRRRNKEV